MLLSKRAAGILCPIFSLPNSEGIGTLGKEAYDFADFLAQSNQTYWQILPIGVTSYGDSPYQSFSSYAGNPYFIDLKTLAEEGYIEDADIELDWGGKEYIEYEILWNCKYPILRKAFEQSGFGKKDAAAACKELCWLEDYAVFMALKSHFGGVDRLQWGEGRIKSTLTEGLKKSLEREIHFQMFMQVQFYKQWNALKNYANEKGVYIIGDLPIFVANDSADVWAAPEYFYLDAEGQSTVVAG